MELITDISFEKVEFDSMKIIPNKVKKVIFVPKVFLAKKVLSFNQLSEGTLKTMALVFYIIKNENSLLLIEEPEVCVHHGLLNSIIEVIKSETDFKQIINDLENFVIIKQVEMNARRTLSPTIQKMASDIIVDPYGASDWLSRGTGGRRWG